MGLDCTDNGRRIVFCCSKPRAQLGTNETPSPLSTRTKTVVMRSGSCRTLIGSSVKDLAAAAEHYEQSQTMTPAQHAAN